MSGARRVVTGLAALVIAGAVWLPLLHCIFARTPAEYSVEHGVPPMGRELAARHLRLWAEPASRADEIRKMRARNAEWDFMGRSFLVWSLANMGLRDPASKATALSVMDEVIDETLRLEREQGVYHFLLPYAQDGEFSTDPPRSLFLDGEIALMLGARRLLEEKDAYKPLLTQRVDEMVARMKLSPVLSAESYPNECWTFCNTVALAAIRVGDHLDGSDHSGFLRDWVSTARARLVDPKTGLLVAMYTPSGHHLYGPEGSTVWMASHCLQIVDADFAAEQYARARNELGRSILGFGYALEWPASWRGEQDVDSGPVVPLLGISAGSSGLAFVGASAFKDGDFLSSLVASLQFAGFPSVEHGALKYCASNQVGDAVLLYSTVLGPMWDKVKAKGTE